MLVRAWWLAGALALGCSCSPYGGGSFACTSDTQCTPDGVCAMGFCAFPDQNCDSKFRYGELSGPSSGQCVGATNPDVDAAVDADMTPTPDGAVCYGTGLVHPCFAAPPTGALTFTNTVINTDTSSMCASLVGANANAWCVLAGTSITISGGGFLAGIGSRPLVLVSTGTINVQGTLAVGSSRTFNSIGAAGNAPGCNAGTAPTLTSGGAGGSFAGKGGNGAVAGGGTAGTSGNTLAVTALRGGCPGQDGADAAAMGRGGDGGDGGGAVWLYAATSITIAGAINASGMAGLAADANSSSGGGGGGAGGFIGLESPSVMNTGNVFANGGGGGEASGSMSAGAPGGESPNAATAGPGGAGGSSFGTDGGNGSLGATLTGAPGAAACTTPCTTPAAGGGGGGGAGIIKVLPAQTIGGNVSPPAT